MTNQQKAKARFVKRYGPKNSRLDCTEGEWEQYLAIYLFGWADAQKQTCQMCNEPLPRPKGVIVCRKCHFGEKE